MSMNYIALNLIFTYTKSIFHLKYLANYIPIETRYDIANEIHKPLFVFVCVTQFIFLYTCAVYLVYFLCYQKFL